MALFVLRAVQGLDVLTGTRPLLPPPQVLMVDVERGAIVVKGSVPGKPGNVVEIAPAKKLGKNIN